MFDTNIDSESFQTIVRQTYDIITRYDEAAYSMHFVHELIQFNYRSKFVLYATQKQLDNIYIRIIFLLFSSLHK